MNIKQITKANSALDLNYREYSKEQYDVTLWWDLNPEGRGNDDYRQYKSIRFSTQTEAENFFDGIAFFSADEKQGGAA